MPNQIYGAAILLHGDGVAHLYKTDDDFTAFDVAPPLGGYIGWEIYSGGWQHVMNKYSEIHFKFRDDLRVLVNAISGGEYDIVALPRPFGFIVLINAIHNMRADLFLKMSLQVR